MSSLGSKHISPDLPSEDKDGGEDPDDEVLLQSEDEGECIAPEVPQGDPEEEGYADVQSGPVEIDIGEVPFGCRLHCH